MERTCQCGCTRSLRGRRIDCHYFEEACRSRARRREDAGLPVGRLSLRGRMSLRELAELEREMARRERAAYERGRRARMLDDVERLEKLADFLVERHGARASLERVEDAEQRRRQVAALTWTPEQAEAFRKQVVSGELERRKRERRELADEIWRRFGLSIRIDARGEELIERAAQLERSDDVEATKLRLLALREELLGEAVSEADAVERLAIYMKLDEVGGLDELAEILVAMWRERGEV